MMILTPAPAGFHFPCMPWSTSPECLVHNPIVTVTTKTVSFMKDPAGYIASKLQQANESLASNVLPQLVKALHPDLSAHWFLDAYRVSFAVAVILWGCLFGWQFVQYARKRIGPEEMAETIMQYTPMFFLGAAFGPAIGNVLLRLVGALCGSIISWGGDGSMGKDAKTFTKLIQHTNPDMMVGGSMVAILIFAVMLVGFLIVLVGLLFMYVTLYISGSVFPVGWAWITKGGGREHGFKILRVWLGVLASQPIMFMALHVAMAMVSAGLIGDVGNAHGKSKGLAVLMALVGGALALVMVAAAPFGLAKMMPVGPSESSASGPGLSGWGSKGSKSSSFGRGGAGGDSGSDSQTGQLARSGGEGGMEAAAESGAASTGVGLAAVAAKKGVDKAKETGQEASAQGQDASEDAGGGADGGGSLSSAASDGGGVDLANDETGQAGDGQQGPSSNGQGNSESEGHGQDSPEGLGGSVAEAAARDNDTGQAPQQKADSRGDDQDDSQSNSSGKPGRGAGLMGAARSFSNGLGQAAQKGSQLADTISRHAGSHMDHQHPDEPRSRR